ncbi:MAG: hypothetical protein Q8K67_12480 [Geothrix sp.]|nr:hypothetical protein [Geothrix sp.]
MDSQDSKKATLVLGPPLEKITTNGTKTPYGRRKFTNSIILPWAIPLWAAARAAFMGRLSRRPQSRSRPASPGAEGPDNPHRSAGACLRALGLFFFVSFVEALKARKKRSKAENQADLCLTVFICVNLRHLRLDVISLKSFVFKSC